MTRRLPMLAASLLLALAARPAPGQQMYRPMLPDPPAREIIHEFAVASEGGTAAAGRSGTAWKVQYARGMHKGLYITGAWFKRSLDEPWMQVLADARIADLFVPYHESSGIRFFDLTGFSFDLSPVKEEDAGLNGVVLPPFEGDPYPTVVREVRDRGVIWKDYANGVRRGRELVLWSGLEAGNYMYLMQYGFQDDGTIACRVGATGQNLPGARKQPHMHNAHWRVDVDLADGKKNNAMLMTHFEATTALRAEDTKEPFNYGVEGGVDWKPEEFTMVRVESDRKNAAGKPIAYDLMPLRQGNSRHKEPFTHHDLWVSRSHPDRPQEMLFANLPTIVRNHESVEETDVVLWITTSSHHEPRDEDGKPNPARRLWRFDDGWEGSALVMWSGFDLRPRNLFDRTPFYPYTPTPPGRPPADERGRVSEPDAGAR